MRALLLIVTLCSCLFPAYAQKSVKDVLASMPDSIVPYLDAENISELCKFTDGSNAASVKNALSGTTSVDSLAVDFAKLRLNDVVDMQLRLLPSGDTAQVVCVIKTFKKPLVESVVRFFTTDWQPLASTFGLPDASDASRLEKMFIHRPDTMSQERFDGLSKYIEPIVISADYSGSEKILTYDVDVPFVQKEEISGIRAIIKRKSFKWDGNTFKEY